MSQPFKQFHSALTKLNNEGVLSPETLFTVYSEAVFSTRYLSKEQIVEMMRYIESRVPPLKGYQNLFNVILHAFGEYSNDFIKASPEENPITSPKSLEGETTQTQIPKIVIHDENGEEVIIDDDDDGDNNNENSSSNKRKRDEDEDQDQDEYGNGKKTKTE